MQNLPQKADWYGIRRLEIVTEPDAVGDETKDDVTARKYREASALSDEVHTLANQLRDTDAHRYAVSKLDDATNLLDEVKQLIADAIED